MVGGIDVDVDVDVDANMDVDVDVDVEGGQATVTPWEVRVGRQFPRIETRQIRLRNYGTDGFVRTPCVYRKT